MAKFQTEVPYFLEILNFLTIQCGTGGRKPPCPNQLDSSSRFNTIPACDGQTDGHTTTAYTALAWRCAVEGFLLLAYHCQSDCRHSDCCPVIAASLTSTLAQSTERTSSPETRGRRLGGRTCRDRFLHTASSTALPTAPAIGQRVYKINSKLCSKKL